MKAILSGLLALAFVLHASPSLAFPPPQVQAAPESTADRSPIQPVACKAQCEKSFLPNEGCGGLKDPEYKRVNDAQRRAIQACQSKYPGLGCGDENARNRGFCQCLRDASAAWIPSKRQIKNKCDNAYRACIAKC